MLWGSLDESLSTILCEKRQNKCEPKARQCLIATDQDMKPESKASFGQRLTTSTEQLQCEDFIKGTRALAALNEKQDVDSNKKYSPEF